MLRMPIFNFVLNTLLMQVCKLDLYLCVENANLQFCFNCSISPCELFMWRECNSTILFRTRFKSRIFIHFAYCSKRRHKGQPEQETCLISSLNLDLKGYYACIYNKVH